MRIDINREYYMFETDIEESLKLVIEHLKQDVKEAQLNKESCLSRIHIRICVEG